jgi:hypothetical protein
MLDFGPSHLNFNNEARWLGVEVRADAVAGNCGGGAYVALSPRQSLSAAPYALGLRLPFTGTGTNAISGVLNVTNTSSGAITGTGGSSGSAAGVSGYSPSAGGIGVFGRATSTSGTTYGGWFQSASPGGYGIAANSIGGGVAARFYETSAGSSAHCVQIATNGNSTSRALFAEHTGTGDCGFFNINNATSGAEAVEGRTNGSGDSIQGINTGTGRAGLFQVANSGNTSNALHGTTNGGGHAVAGVQTGTGRAGSFQITNAANGSPALFASTTGSGRIAQFDTLSANSTGVAITVANASNPNPALILSHLNSSVPTLRVGGTTRVDVIEIVGADVAERFPASEELKPGQVVMIDADNPGHLCLSRGSYNRKVAGVVSGANDLPAGTILGHLPGQEDAPPIALSGRVWVDCDASEHAIDPGDLLTTANTPGQAMKAADLTRAQGATIGKAMTALPAGKSGLVLTLINLH